MVNQTLLYIVFPTISPIFATVIQKENSPLSVIMTGLFFESKDFTRFISFCKNSLSTQGHSPNGKNGSFSTCQYSTVGESLYLKATFSSIRKIFSCCSSFLRFLANSGKWHSGHLGVFPPIANKILAPFF